MHCRDGDDHDADNHGASGRLEETQREEDAAATFCENVCHDEQSAGAKPESLNENSGSAQARPSEPAKQRWLL